MSTTTITTAELVVGSIVAFLDPITDEIMETDEIVRIADGVAWFACDSGIEMNANHLALIVR